MELNYPKNHRKIVSELLAGKFILQKNEELFDPIVQSFRDFYTRFFDKSFGYELKITTKYIYLVANESNEKLSRNITLFLAILCYELDREGKNFNLEIKTNYFETEEVKQKILASEYINIVSNIEDIVNLYPLIKQMTDRNIVERKNDNKFVFTDAVEIFYEFAADYLNQNKDE
ncbi:MAG: hypothetical protein RL329_3097 [Bacteroidota bacterium]|jgi:hypothetical protein